MSKLLKEALESVKGISEEMSVQITEAFEAEVEKEAEKKVEEIKSSIMESTDVYVKKVLESHVLDLQEKFEKASTKKAEELTEAYTNDLKKQIEESYKADKAELEDFMHQYISYAVKEFVNENKADWKAEVDIVKANAIMESAHKFANDFGIELVGITSEDDAKSKLDEAVAKNLKLEKEIETLKKVQVMESLTADMPMTQVEKLMSLTESFKDLPVSDFEEKVKLIKDTLVESVDVPRKKENVNENTSKRASWK